MLEGFYKCEYSVDGAVSRSVMYVHGGAMLGGNTAFAHIGDYAMDGDEVVAEIESRRHTGDPAYPSLLGQDVSQIRVRGRADGACYRFTGSSPQRPGAVFHSLMTPIDEASAPPPGLVGEGGVINGLYSLHLRMLDGVAGGLTGVMLLHDGRILGGDAHFYYLGSYTSANRRWKGEILNQEHTPARGEHPIFGGHDVGIGFSGTCSDEGAELEASALAGRRSLRLAAVLRRIRAA